MRYFPRADYLEAAASTHQWPSDTQIVFVHVTVTGSQVRTRVEDRALERDDWKLAHWDDFWASAQAAECRWRGAHHILFDNSAEGVAADSIEAALAEFA